MQDILPDNPKDYDKMLPPKIGSKSKLRKIFLPLKIFQLVQCNLS